MCLEDLDASSLRTNPALFSLLKIWGDKYVFQAEIKGGYVAYRPSLVIVTSNYSMPDLLLSAGY